MAIHPSEYDLCQCGERKTKVARRCRQCNYRRISIRREAHKWALAVLRKEPIIMLPPDPAAQALARQWEQKNGTSRIYAT